MDEFLKTRKISESVIQKLKDDKIDCEAVVAMTDDNLRRYLSAYGDRVALMAFARSRLRSSSTDSSMPGASRVPKKNSGNKNATRLNRRVELGWMNFNPIVNSYKQVRTHNGGGTRHFSVEKTLCMRDLLDTAFIYFFPNGMCKYGPRGEFFGEIRDFKGDRIEETITVNELYEKTRIKILRIYLYTRQLDSEHYEHGLVPTQQPVPEANPKTDQLEPVTDQTELETDHVDSGTPEVTFNPRHRLRLQRRSPVLSSSLQGGRSSSPINIDVDLDSEDEEIQQAIQASLKDVRPVEEANTACNLEGLLLDFQKTAVLSDTQTKIIVFRKNVLESSLRALSRKSLNLKARLYVKFSGEIGEDYGGPRREFFRLAIGALHDSRFFEGPDNSKIFTHDLSLVENQHYLVIGRLVALSLAQEGPGIHFMDQHLFELMVGKETDLTNADIPGLPQELTEIIKKLQDVDTFDQRDQFLEEYGEKLIELGLGNPYSMKLDSRGHMINMIKKNHIYYRISSEITQFIQGMNEVSGAWEFVRKNSTIFRPLFCHSPKPLTSDDMVNLFKIIYSDQGSNARRLEEVTVYAWELFLQSIEEREVPVTFSDILSFATGADHIPPAGFSQQIEIQFYSDRRLPSSSTCALQLWLPRLEDPGPFSGMLVRAIKESGGFFKI